MFLTGYIKVDGQLSYLAWKDIKATECLWTFSPYHADEIYDVELGKIPEYPVISSPMVLKEFYNEDYLLGILKRTKVSGKITCYGQNQQNELMLDTSVIIKFEESEWYIEAIERSLLFVNGERKKKHKFALMTSVKLQKNWD